jgi:predicted nucleic acid-binding protein
MKEDAPRLVVDASVAIKLFVHEKLSDRAHELFTQLALPGAQFYVPGLFYVECTNVLWKYVRRADMPLAYAAIAVDQLGRLALRTVSSSSLVARALEVAYAHDVTAYDALYAALAQQVNAPLVTADEALVRKLQGLDAEVRWLGL